MKKFFGMFALILAIAASAFTGTNKKSRAAGNSYTYDLYGKQGQDLQANLNDPSNYTFVGTGPLSCSGTAHRCGVEDATDNGLGHPNFNMPYTIRTRN